MVYYETSGLTYEQCNLEQCQQWDDCKESDEH